MRTLKSHIVLLILLCGTLCSYGQNSNDLSTKIGYQVSLLQESKTADDVYIIKSRIDKLSLEAKLLGDKLKIRDAYLIMSDKFAFFNHFKSGVLVYFNYLEIDKEIHQKSVKSLKDSIQNIANNQISPINNQQANNQSVESNAVDYSKESATDNAMVSKSSGSFDVKWLFALVLVSVIMLIIFIGQRKKVLAMKSELVKDKAELKDLFRISSNVSMLSGAIRYAREFSAHCALVLKDLIEITNHNNESNADSTKANKAVDVFKRISSGDNKAL